MFDPHRTRYSNRRFYTRKGQVIQAKRIDAPLGIESRLVPMYKDYIVKNRIITGSDFPTNIPVINEIKYTGDGSTTLYEDLAMTISPEVKTYSVIIAIGTDPSDSNYWLVYVVYVYGGNYSFTIPTGFRWKSWTSTTSINATFELNNDGTTGITFPLIAGSSGVAGGSEIIVHKISKSMIKFE